MKSDEFNRILMAMCDYYANKELERKELYAMCADFDRVLAEMQAWANRQRSKLGKIFGNARAIPRAVSLYTNREIHRVVLNIRLARAVYFYAKLWHISRAYYRPSETAGSYQQ